MFLDHDKQKFFFLIRRLFDWPFSVAVRTVFRRMKVFGDGVESSIRLVKFFYLKFEIIKLRVESSLSIKNANILFSKPMEQFICDNIIRILI